MQLSNTSHKLVTACKLSLKNERLILEEQKSKHKILKTKMLFHNYFVFLSRTKVGETISITLIKIKKLSTLTKQVLTCQGFLYTCRIQENGVGDLKNLSVSQKDCEQL